MSVKNSKEDKQIAVSRAILEILEKDGFLGVTHSKISRKSGVSRAWIYEYIGKAKGDLVDFATDVFASYFSRTKMARFPKSKEDFLDQMGDGVHFLLDAAAQDPTVIKLYFRFRGTKTPVGDIIKKYEKIWLDGATKSAKEVFGFSAEQASLAAELMLTLRLGLGHRLATSSTPKETRARIEKIFSTIHQLI